MKLSNKLWIHWGKNPNDVFQYLKISKAGAKLDESKKFIQWFRFVKDYRDKKGAHWFVDYEIYHSLLKVAPEAKIATILQSLKDIKDLKNLAEIVQNYQFKLWVGRKETPDSIASLFGIQNRGPMGAERDPSARALQMFVLQG
ncbi:hypothetical protein PC118_g25076 [Phytophthora cactorum]|uniref:RXLR phytopathogen effector protein WY-domain domain-containing protein n=2 Tax=Phytophthora cactorum TaxID=29920 RepID=A0A8T1ED35_9STRA|nr:hypothetical protein PC118_g25076 [Phytophthora cactorum]